MKISVPNGRLHVRFKSFSSNETAKREGEVSSEKYALFCVEELLAVVSLTALKC